MPLRRTVSAITSVLNGPGVRFPSSGTPLAHRNRRPQHPRAVARLNLLMASQPSRRMIKLQNWAVAGVELYALFRAATA